MAAGDLVILQSGAQGCVTMVLGSHAAVQRKGAKEGETEILKVNVRTLTLSQAAAAKCETKHQERKPQPVNQLEAVINGPDPDPDLVTDTGPDRDSDHEPGLYPIPRP